ncbi:hypothetical protein DL766_007246 [Monosporascus sp. MC13-8B]|nr:hypothetical protein DL763_005200 [Monosporascus cannonballus]RYP24640.1 hypothetical protein DL766_007246 [Monosporascus sp. MC13-8B]
MWIELSSATPFMIKIYCGGVNAVSAERHSEDPSTKFRCLKLNMDKGNIQDYIVAPEQLWVDGIATESGIVRRTRMTIAAGGKIKQTIAQARHELRVLETRSRSSSPSTALQPRLPHSYGPQPSPHPIDASTHTEANLPFLDLCEESSGVEALKNVNEIEKDKGLAQGSEPSVKPRPVKLDRHGNAIPTGSQVDLSGDR